jgi:hypothetical protein
MPRTNENSEPSAKFRLEKARQVDDRLARGQDAREEDDRRDARHPGEQQHRLIAEPVVARSLLQHVLERAEETRHRQETDEVEILEERIVRLVEVDQGQSRDRHRDAGHDIDEEQPMPRQRVGEVAADRGADGGSQRRHETDQRRDQTHARAREDDVGGREHRRDHAAADEALNGAP